MMTYLRIDDKTGAMFAGSETPDDGAVVSFFTAPRGADDVRSAGSAAFMSEWLAALPKRVSRVSAWASNDRDARFLETMGFAAQDGHVGTDGCCGMVLERRAA